MKAQKSTTGYKPNIFLSEGKKDSNSFLFILATKYSAPTAKIKFTKKEWIKKFIMKIATERSIIGVEQ